MTEIIKFPVKQQQQPCTDSDLELEEQLTNALYAVIKGHNATTACFALLNVLGGTILNVMPRERIDF